MSDWITPTGEVQTNVKSNLLPEDAKREPVIETSMHAGVVFKDGQATYTEQKGTEYQADQGINLDNGILGSARTEGGGHIHGRRVIASDQVVLPGGIPTSAGVAADLGFLVINTDGSFSEVPPDHGPEEASGEDEAGGGEFQISDTGEAAMGEIVSTVDQSAAIAGLSEILERGEVSGRTLERMAAGSGKEPGEVAELVNRAHEGFYEAAADRMADLGVTDEEAFMAFVSQNPQLRGKMAESARALVMGQGAEGFDAVASQFLEQADRYMGDEVIAALDEAGFEHRPDGKGGLIVITHDGMPVPFQVAVRQKIVRFV